MRILRGFCFVEDKTSPQQHGSRLSPFPLVISYFLTNTVLRSGQRGEAARAARRSGRPSAPLAPTSARGEAGPGPCPSSGATPWRPSTTATPLPPALTACLAPPSCPGRLLLRGRRFLPVCLLLSTPLSPPAPAAPISFLAPEGTQGASGIRQRQGVNFVTAGWRVAKVPLRIGSDLQRAERSGSSRLPPSRPTGAAGLQFPSAEPEASV